MRHIVLIGIQLHGNDAGMLRGLFRFARSRPDWVVHDMARPAAIAAGEHLRPAGAIANVVNADVAAHCRALGVPVVNVTGPIAALGEFPSVFADSEAIGRLAADHLRECGLRHFAWFNHMTAFPFIARRGQAFAARLHALGFPCRSFDQDVSLAAHIFGAPDDAGRHDLAAWLKALPRPCGVFATTDHGGRELCWLCERLGLDVPGDVAIIGVDDFDLICETSRPPLSSVRLPNEEIGYRAAAILDGMLAGREAPLQTRFPPLGVRVRQSSDVIAVEDRAVAAALAHIRRHADHRLRVSDVARAAGLNRRSLERRFRAELKLPVLREIHRAMVAKACRLLADTSLPVGEIALQAGFRDVQHLGHVFRRLAGMAPTAYRRGVRTPMTSGGACRRPAASGS